MERFRVKENFPLCLQSRSADIESGFLVFVIKLITPAKMSWFLLESVTQLK